MQLVYKYGLAAPHVNRDLVEAQLRAAHKYRNALVEIERDRRAAVREAEAAIGNLGQAAADLARARLERESAVAAITRHRSKSRKKDEPVELKSAAKRAREAERAASKAFRALRAVIKASPEVIAAVDAIGERAKERVRAARKATEAFWGTYLIVEDAASQAFADTPLYDSSGQPSDPPFLRWTGEGAVAVQLQGGSGEYHDIEERDESGTAVVKRKERTGLTVAAAAKGGDTRLRLTMPDERAWQRMPAWKCLPEVRTHRECEQMARKGEVSLRIGSEGRAPIWGTWRLDMHQPLPEGAIIKWAIVHRTRCGPHDRWHLTLTIEAPHGVQRRLAEEELRHGTLAIDVGWRVVGEELRVAGWRDSEGRSGELRLSAADRALLRAPEAMRGARDVRFDDARVKLAAWLKANWATLPDWLRVTSANIHAWKSESRLAGLWGRWSRERFEGDDAGYWPLESWQARARHEWAVESRTRDQALRRRREKYRVWCAQMADKYETIVIERFDKRQVAVLPQPDANAPVFPVPKAQDEIARHHRFLVATSELMQCIVTACRGRQTTLVAVPCADTTRTCPVCGLVETRDAAASIRLVCDCGAAWDQDVEGAAAVLLARWRERPGDAKIMVGARKDEKDSESAAAQETRWQRAKRLREEKEVRMKGAREAGANGAE
jgi:hypothetical protein